MKHTPLNFARGLHIAAWVWLGYLLLLAGIDWFLYPQQAFGMLRPYYFINGVIALLFLGCAYWNWLQNRLQNYYIPLMLFLIAGLPILANRLWVPPFPPGPMTNIEGLALRLLPVLFLGLVITAWHYDWLMVVVFAGGTAVLEIALVQLNPPNQANAAHAIFVIALVRSASFLVVGYFINQLVQELKNQQAELKQANARLVHHASTVEQLSISRERNRLARELHDTLAHTLSALSVQLETTKAYWNVDTETARDLLEKSLEATRSGLNETRRALKALRASPLEDLGLLFSLQKLAQSAAERGQLTLTLSLPDHAPTLSPDEEQCIYRIAQESIENVVHHANAQHLEVQLSISDTEIHLEIEDDGLGFDLAQNPEADHYGLAGMHERAQLVGAQLEIDSQPDEGTRIQLKINRD